MRLKITHHTVYHYETPSRFVVQSLRLTPSVHDGQKVIDWGIDVESGQAGPGFRDGAGDWVQGWTIRGPVDTVPVRIDGVVETADTAGILRGFREIIHPMVYLQHTVATVPSEGLRDLAAIPGADMDSLDLAHALAGEVSKAIRFQSGVTNLRTTAAEALAQGQGVCQDHAHALISIARQRDLPARYVSGYLYADPDGAAHEAAHAWVEIHVTGLGWVGFDPANRCGPDEKYVRTGSGLDARDAAPVRGIKIAGGLERMDVKVAVEEVGA